MLDLYRPRKSGHLEQSWLDWVQCHCSSWVLGAFWTSGCSTTTLPSISPAPQATSAIGSKVLSFLSRHEQSANTVMTHLLCLYHKGRIGTDELTIGPVDNLEMCCKWKLSWEHFKHEYNFPLPRNLNKVFPDLTTQYSCKPMGMELFLLFLSCSLLTVATDRAV